MKRMLAALVLLIILACALSCAHAQEIPEDILDWMTEHGYENESWHSLRFDLPDGSACAFLLNDWSLYGFLREDGAWRIQKLRMAYREMDGNFRTTMVPKDWVPDAWDTPDY